MVSLRSEFEVKEGRLVGKGVADWWVLGTRPLGMAPREPLDDADAETMQDGLKEWGKTTQYRWHGGPAWETLPPVSLLRADLYSENLSTYLQSRLRVHEK